MLAQSGANHGVRRTVPHLLGVTLGFPAMLLVIGLGLATILIASSGLQLAMKIVSCAYLLWLAYRIAFSASVTSGAGNTRPLTFTQAVAFQWVNPKAWMASVGAISAYTGGHGAVLYMQVGIVALVTSLVTLSSTWTWTMFGAGLRRWLRAPQALRLFNFLMAVLLVASIIPIMGEIWSALVSA